MTLHKSIEAERWLNSHEDIFYSKEIYETLIRAVRALPDKPKTEAEIIEMAHAAVEEEHGGGSRSKTETIIRALRDAGVLYVKGVGCE